MKASSQVFWHHKSLTCSSQHLLAAIDAYSEAHSHKDLLATIQLKQLIQDIRDASDEKHGIQEFYETLERVVNELRGMTEHSTAFLARVRKAEAPNYYEIIKRPMDLGTVLKKVKSQQYKSKQQFADDLTLIWDNCLEYNTWVDHPLRKSAQFMRNKANHLLQFVADLPAKATPAPSSTNRQASVMAASEADADGDTDEEADETNLTRKGTTSRKQNSTKGPKSEDGQHTREPSVSMEMDSFFTPERSASPATAPVSARDTGALAKRKSLTARTGLVPFEERPALLRTSQGMSDFAAHDEDYPIIASTSLVTIEDLEQADTDASQPADLDDNVDTNQESSPPRHSSVTSSSGATSTKKPMPLPVQQLSGRAQGRSASVQPVACTPHVSEHQSDPDSAWWDLVLKDGNIRSGLPLLPFKPASLPKPKPATGVTSREAQPDSLEAKMKKNLESLTEIRRLSGLIFGDATPTPAPPDTEMAENPADDQEAEVQNLTPSPTCTAADLYDTVLASSAASSQLHDVCGFMLSHAGFEAVDKSAMTVLCAIVAQYMSNLGRTCRFFADLYQPRFSGPTLLRKTLYENGIDSVDTLHNYAQEEVPLYGARLDQILDRLTTLREKQGDLSQAYGNSDMSLGIGPLSHSTPPVVSQQEPYVPLDSQQNNERLGAIEAQVGLLRPFLLARLQTAPYGLVEDAQLMTSGVIPAPSLDTPVGLNGKMDMDGTSTQAKKRTLDNHATPGHKRQKV